MPKKPDIDYGSDPRDTLPILMRRAHELAVSDFADNGDAEYRDGSDLAKACGVAGVPEHAQPTGALVHVAQLLAAVYNGTQSTLERYAREGP